MAAGKPEWAGGRKERERMSRWIEVTHTMDITHNVSVSMVLSIHHTRHDCPPACNNDNN